MACVYCRAIRASLAQKSADRAVRGPKARHDARSGTARDSPIATVPCCAMLARRTSINNI